MINRIYQKEEFFDYDKIKRINQGVFIYKNPTQQEWNKYIPIWARGYIDLDGNLYIEGYEDKSEEGSRLIHYELSKILMNKLTIKINNDKNTKDPLKYGLHVQRVNDTKIIKLSESTNLEKIEEEKIEKLFSQAKKYNFDLSFSMFIHQKEPYKSNISRKYGLAL